MKITVLGATGRIGRLVVRALLDDGHDVTALVRSPARMTVTDPQLTVIPAELTDAAAVDRAVDGGDAVISALGPSLDPRVRSTQLADGTRLVVDAMLRAGVRRYIGLATPSVPDLRDRPSVSDRLLPIGVTVVLPNAVREIQGMTEAVGTSALDWTIARITAPNDKPATGAVRAGFLGRDRIGSPITRADVAAFLVDQLTDTRFVRAAPAISN